MDQHDLAAVLPFLTSLGVGLLMGLERERRPDAKAGLRTFALVAVLGTLCAMLAQAASSAWLLPAVLLALTATMVAADRGPEPDTTTTVALLLCFGLGATAWYGHTQLVSGLALASTALLHFKTELHAATRNLSRQDMMSFLQFVLITCIVLPLLPDQGYGPYGSLNPYRIWLMVVLVAGIGLAGYVTLRIVGDRAPPLLGLLGGLISSTATTLVFSQKARSHAEQLEPALLVILIANLVLLARIALITTVVAPGALQALAPMLAIGLVAGAVMALRVWRRNASRKSGEELAMKNPLEMGAALTFGAIYGAALVVMAWLNDLAGAAGIYAVAPVLGLTDMDAVTLSTLKLFSGGGLDAPQVAVALVLALAANAVFKAGIAFVVGGAALGRGVALGFLPVVGGLAAGLLLR